MSHHRILIILAICVVVALATWTGALIVWTISLFEERREQRFVRQARPVVAQSLQEAALEMARREQPAYAALDEDYFAALPLDEPESLETDRCDTCRKADCTCEPLLDEGPLYVPEPRQACGLTDTQEFHLDLWAASFSRLSRWRFRDFHNKARTREGFLR